MKRFILPALLVAFGASAANPGRREARPEEATGGHLGDDLPGDRRQKTDPIPSPGRSRATIVREGGEETTRWSFSVTAEKSPPKIDFTIKRGGTSELLLLGVLKLDGDELAVAMLPALTTKDGTPVFIRPEAVESTAQNRAIIATFKRKK